VRIPTNSQQKINDPNVFEKLKRLENLDKKNPKARPEQKHTAQQPAFKKKLKIMGYRSPQQ